MRTRLHTTPALCQFPNCSYLTGMLFDLFQRQRQKPKKTLSKGFKTCPFTMTVHANSENAEWENGSGGVVVSDINCTDDPLR